VKKSRFSESQIIGVVRKQEAGVTTEEVCRQHGTSQQTFYHWKAKYGGMEVSDAQKPKTLEDQNRRLEKLLADSMLDVSALKDLLGKKPTTPAARLRADDGGSQDGAAQANAWRCRVARSAACAGGRAAAVRLSASRHPAAALWRGLASHRAGQAAADRVR
jgi:putative transposase